MASASFKLLALGGAAVLLLGGGIGSAEAAPPVRGVPRVPGVVMPPSPPAVPGAVKWPAPGPRPDRMPGWDWKYQYPYVFYNTHGYWPAGYQPYYPSPWAYPVYPPYYPPYYPGAIGGARR